MNNLTTHRDYIVQRPKQEKSYPIPKREWNRISEKIDNLPKTKSSYVNWASISTGAAISSFLALIGFINLTGVPTWVIVVTSSVFSSTSVGALILFLLTKGQKDQRSISIQSIRDDMDFLADGFDESQDSENPPNGEGAVNEESTETGVSVEEE